MKTRLSKEFSAFIDRVVKLIAPLGIQRGNVAVLLLEKDSADEHDMPEIEICRYRPKNVISRLKRNPRFTLQDIDDLIGILEDIRDFRDRKWPDLVKED